VGSKKGCTVGATPGAVLGADNLEIVMNIVIIINDNNRK